MSEDNTFIAVGPAAIGFATNGANIDWGGLMSGTEFGVVGRSSDVDVVIPISRIGVFGSGDKFGVYGTTEKAGPNSGFKGEPRFAGVFGTSDTQPGVVGTSFGSSGVLGQVGDAAGVAPAGICGTSQQQIGVYGSSSGSRGMFGESERSIGVHGASQQSVGVLGWSGAPAPSTFTAAVFGTSAANFGVAGTSANTAGVLGTSTNNYGVIAISGQIGPIFGVPLPSPAAVFGTSAKKPGVSATSTDSYGVAAFSLNSDGMHGLSAALPAPRTLPTQVPAGVRGQSTNGGFGVLGVTISTPTSAGAGVTGTCTGRGFGVFGYNPDPAGFAGYFQGNLFVTGQIFAGVKDAIVPFPDGSKRMLHCMESPEHWFEDFGSARLKRGRATVKLDADFAKVVTLDGYRVFLTPEGDCKGLYVQSKRGASFEVRELQGGTSSVAFSYRIVAKRKDIKRHARFAKIDMPVFPMPVGKSRAARGRKPPRLPPATRVQFTALEKEARKQAT